MYWLASQLMLQLLMLSQKYYAIYNSQNEHRGKDLCVSKLLFSNFKLLVYKIVSLYFIIKY